MNGKLILENSLYFLALVNPASKILILSSLQREYSKKELRAISVRSTLVAALIILLLTLAGNFLLEKVFHIELYSLKIAGGAILFLVGLMAVRKGQFYEETPEKRQDNFSVVPIAAPLIAGPATITGAISFASEHGIVATLLSVGIALGANLLFMLFSPAIGKGLERIHATGPLIRITGLIVSAVAVQLVLGGLESWVRGIAAG